jgi:hypothetical protein
MDLSDASNERYAHDALLFFLALLLRSDQKESVSTICARLSLECSYGVWCGSRAAPRVGLNLYELRETEKKGVYF